jgi:thymidine phosphorylase
MTTTLELINAISNGNAVEIEDAFNSAMAEKVASKLDDLRVQIAQNMFNAQAPEEVTVDSAEHQTEE